MPLPRGTLSGLWGALVLIGIGALALGLLVSGAAALAITAGVRRRAA